MPDTDRKDTDRKDSNRKDLAQDRTDLAEDRTLLAHERSFASWVRTGLTAAGIGLGFNALFRSIDPTWLAKGIASIFLIIGIFVTLSAARRACAVTSQLEAHRIATLQPMRIRLIAWALATAILLLGLAIWFVVE